jgi:putative copper resistance protein D
MVFTNPPTQEGSLPINPIPPNADSVAIGETLYQENCFPCHGDTGAGDGPVGRTLNPPPADLTLHTQPGVHPDGRLYNWITNGFQDSVMPAFKDKLTDDERWHLVNYIRTLAQ